MRQRAINSRILFVYPSNEEIHQELQSSIDAVKDIQSSELHVLTDILDDPPPKFVSVAYVSSPVVDDEDSEEVVFEDDNTIVGVIHIPSLLNIFYKPSSFKAQFNFRVSSSSEASDENFEYEQNYVVPPPAENTLEVHQDSPTRKSSTGDNVATENSTVDKVTQQVADLESKLVLVLKSLFEIKVVAPSELELANQLDQLILFRLSHTLEDVKSRYKGNMDHHITTINTCHN
ncbi:unnamed protein product [Lactuca saligna]|uniref:Uncharacterized protein n=1 Tax=Lactuca saligna TaxID=75948 RepID=A0AA35YES4_LACSI|nr:unnamed protein product [Lactuca saligna]